MLGGVTRQGGGGGGVVSRRLANSYTRTYCTYYYKNGPNQSVKYARILKTLIKLHRKCQQSARYINQTASVPHDGP